MVRDADWGPVITVGIGGVQVERTRGVISLFPGVDEHSIRRRMLAVSGLQAMPEDQALARIVLNFADLVSSVGDEVDAIDVNPLLFGPDGIVAVDALVIPRNASQPIRPVGQVDE